MSTFQFASIQRLLATSLISLALLGCSPAAQDPLHGLAAQIEKEQAEWGIPGLAVAVVHRDQIIHAQGYGVLGIDTSQPVNEHTLFGVASTTKAMTAASLAMLVDEGKLNWDDRVVDHLPWFALSDDWVTQEVRIRDLLMHRVGVGRMTGNRIQFMPTASPKDVIKTMRYHDMEAPFRSRYVYSNVMYSVAGEVVAAVSGMSWGDFMQQRLFTPLQMNRSNTSITHFQSADDNIARPHQWIDGELVRIPWRNFDNVAASASVNSSVHDMAQWMRLQLGEPGVYQGNRLLSEAVMQEMHAPQIATNRVNRESPVNAYGLGWSLSQYQGYAISQHGGATDGFNTALFLVPELDLGIVVITNTFSTYTQALVRNVIDRIAGHPAHDWSNQYLSRYQDRYDEVSAERQAIHEARELDTEPSLSPADLVGTYYHQQYGRADIRLDEGNLILEFWQDGQSLLTLEHWHHDTWRAHWQNPAQREKFIEFHIENNGQSQDVVMDVTWTLRPALLQVGIYPTPYSRNTRFLRQ